MSVELEQIDELIAQKSAELKHWQLIRELSLYDGPLTVDATKNEQTGLLESLYFDDGSTI